LTLNIGGVSLDGEMKQDMNIRKPRSAGAVAKRAGCSRERARKWAIANGVEKMGSYYFTPEDEKRFLDWSAVQRVGRPFKDPVDLPPKRPRGRPRKEVVPKEPGKRGRPRKII
jgi:hypothetical protein